MTDNQEVHFAKIRYAPGYHIFNSEKVSIADVDNDGATEIVIVRWGNNGKEYTGEIAIYDMKLGLKASDRWVGLALDVAVSDIDGDGKTEIIVAGSISIDKPVLKVYRYNENYKGNLELSSQTSWGKTSQAFQFAKSIHVFDHTEPSIAVLTICQGERTQKGYAQLRLYDKDMVLKRVNKWDPIDASIVPWGHCMKSVDFDGNGKGHLITLVNYRHENKQKVDLRVFDHQLNLIQICDFLKDEAILATCMGVEDIDGDGEVEIAIAGEAFSEVWKGATNSLMILNSQLSLKESTSWKTFRHSWVWDMQIMDLDKDGSKEIITFGGTAMNGKNQEDANIMGEICLWDSSGLATKDMFIWQGEPGEDTRPSRALAFIDNDRAKILITTSRWSKNQQTRELEIGILDFEQISGAIAEYSSLIKAYDEHDTEVLDRFITQNKLIAPIALESLAFCDPGEAARIAGKLLKTKDQNLFLRTVEILRKMGEDGIEELHEIGFSIPKDWAIVSPFDNTNNRGFNTQYKPELELNMDAFYAGKDKIVRWGKMDGFINDIYIDLAYTHFESFERTGIEYGWNTRRTESIAYLLTYIYSPKNMEAQINLGSSDGIKLWLNGELKSSIDKIRWASPDQDKISINLKEGKNTVMLKVANYKTNGWGFFFRITDSQNEIIPGLRYESPDVSYIHNQIIPINSLIPLLQSQDEYLRCLASHQLVLSGDKRGNDVLLDLLRSEDSKIRAKAGLIMTQIGDKRGLDTLAKEAPCQDYLFQIAAGNSLKRAGDKRGEKFSIENLKDDSGKSIVELRVTHRENGFRVSPIYENEETAHADIGINRLFHLGDDISIRYAIILSFGIREPKYRGMGLGEAALKRASDIIEEMGYNCSLVCTGVNLMAHRLYCQYGYVDRRFPWIYVKHLNRREIQEKDPNIIARDYISSDKSEVEGLIRQYNLNTVGPADWILRENFGPWTRVAEYEGKLIGYADVHVEPFEPAARINVLHIDMNFPDKHKVLIHLLSSIHDYALEEDKEMVTFQDPPVNYRDFILRMGYEIEPTNLRHRWVGMFKVINLPGFLKEISSLLSLRLKRSLHYGWQGSLCIKGSRLNATIIIDKDGNITVDDKPRENADVCIITSDSIITDLVACNGNMWESYKDNLLTVKPLYSERTRNLIETLFPVLPTKQGGWW